MVWWFVFAASGLLLAALHYYLTCTYRFWRERSIPCIRGAVPGLGNVYPVLLRKQNHNQLYEEFYSRMTGCSMAGFYDMRTPILMLRDPELVKTVLVKDFHSFDDNAQKIDEKLDPLLALHPFLLSGARWKAARTSFSSAFTSGKLKFMYVTVKHVCARLTKYLDEKMERSNGMVELELKELFSRYTAEVVADVIFGVEGDSFNSEKDGAFREVGKAIFEPSLLKGLRHLVAFTLPFLRNLLKVSFLPLEVDRFFRKLVRDVVRMRREKGIERNDFLQLMMQARQTRAASEADDDDDDYAIAAHATSFFVDGYETSSIALSFLVYQLATHPKVQQRVRQEVEAMLAKHESLTYEALQEMTYLDQVLDESLRLYPPGGSLRKLCTKDTILEGSDGLTYHIKAGSSVIISIQGLHRDPYYWPNPEKFDPERFSAECKQERRKFVFLPFGEGPRICVGMRMALMQVKAAAATMVRNYSLELSPRTKLPLQLDPNYFINSAKGGLWVYVKPV